MSAPRGLSADEAAAWARLARSVTPLAGRAMPVLASGEKPAAPILRTAPAKPAAQAPKAPSAKPSEPGTAPKPSGLDGHWRRKFDAGTVSPDFTLDLHGATLDAAYDRLMHGMAQAQAMGARVILVVTGKPRPADPADRAHRRGAIRAKILDWLAASSHGPTIAEVRGAHRRHGGEGALYLVLRRQRG
ncbi:MAG: DNA mismatch repair protein MutS [Erythrobacter sp.]|nr:DNA mismatch repair protein MutS [Erythrobacter sp.]